MSNRTENKGDNATPPSDTGRRMRADARRNVDTLLKAAKSMFATAGVNVPIREIAAKAGVGVGTVYRRFPTRADLIAAVFRHEIDGCADMAKSLAAEYEPLEALSRWVLCYLDLLMTKRGLAAALHSGEPAYGSLPGYFEERLVPSLQRLLTTAGSDIRADISAAELLRAVALLSSPGTSGDVAQTRRMVTLLIDGLSVPLPGAMSPAR